MEDPYAPPKSDALAPTIAEVEAQEDGTNCWREGNLIVAPKGATLPDRCVRCNEPAGGYRLKRRLYYHHPAFYLIILGNIIVYAIVAMAVRKTGVVHVGLCRRHRRLRVVGILIGWVGFFGSLFLLIAGGAANSGVMAIAGIVGMIGAIAAGIVMSRVVLPRRIDNDQLWLKVGRPFLDSIR